VEPVELFWKGNVANPHTSHCLGSGDILISCLGDPSGNGKGIHLFVVLEINARDASGCRLQCWHIITSSQFFGAPGSSSSCLLLANKRKEKRLLQDCLYDTP